MPSLLNRSKPALPDWRTDPRVAAVQAQHDQLLRDSAPLIEAIVAAERRLAQAIDARDRLEVDRLTGDATEETLLRGRRAVTELEGELRAAKDQAAGAKAQLQRLNEAMTLVTDEAKAAARRAFAPLYRSALERLDDALKAAGEASEECYRIWEVATEQFSGAREVSTRGVIHVPSGGLIQATIAKDLGQRGDRQLEGSPQSAYEAFHREVTEDAFVTSMAGDDVPSAKVAAQEAARLALSPRIAAGPDPARLAAIADGWIGR